MPTYPAHADGGISLAPEPSKQRLEVGSASRGDSVRKWGIPIICLLVLLVPYIETFGSAAGRMDEGTLLVYPELIQRGAVPYRDFETFYGPANPYLLAAVYGVFGVDIAVERSVGLFYRVILFAALFGLLRRWGMAIATLCVLLAGFLLLPLGVVAYAWIGALAFAVASLAITSNSNMKGRYAIGGLLAGLALMFRLDVAPALLLAVLVLLRNLPKDQLVRFLIGFGIGVLPLGAITLAAGWQQVYYNLFLYPVICSSQGRHVPFSWVDSVLPQFFILEVVTAIINVAIGALTVLRRNHDDQGRTLMALALLGLGVLPQAWQRLDIWHVLFVAFLIFSTLPCALFSLVSPGRTPPARFCLAGGLTFAIGLVVSAIIPSIPRFAVTTMTQAMLTDDMSKALVRFGSRSFQLTSAAQARTVSELLDRLDRDSKAGQRLFVGPADLRRTNYADTFIYYFMPKLVPATYFLEMNPLSANRPNSRLAADVKSADWLVLNFEWDDWIEPNRSMEYASNEPNVIVRNEFVPYARVGRYLILRRKDGQA